MERNKLRFNTAVLVYQAGIANVFSVERVTNEDGRNPKRLLQGDFRSCEAFARGLAVAGVDVTTMHCNRAGDIANAEWSENLESAPFSDSFHPVGVAA